VQPIAEEKTVRKQSNVPEEKFYEANGDVLELKQYIFHDKHVSSSESSDDEEEDEKPKKPSAFAPARLGFEEIGYGTYEPNKPKYVVVKNSEPVKHECNAQKNKKNNKLQPRHRHRHHQNKKSQSCGCRQDLIGDQSSISEQSVSYEAPNQNYHYQPHFST